MIVFANNYRGFRRIEIDLNGPVFVVGDNSSGKTSLLHLINLVKSTLLSTRPQLDVDHMVDADDFFSPHFSDADVTIGFIFKTEDDFYTKVVTLKRQADGTSVVARCTVANGEMMLTVKRTATRIYDRAKGAPLEQAAEHILQCHFRNTGFRYVDAWDRVRDINLPPALYMLVRLYDKNIADDDRFGRMIFPTINSMVHFLGPVRGNPERFYQTVATYLFGGGHFPSMLNDISEDVTSRAIIDDFGKNSGLFDKINIEPISKRIKSAPLVVTVERRGKTFFLNQVGIGVSQVAPIIVESTYNKIGNLPATFIIQQPELHLHPQAQAALGEFFYEMSGSSKQIYVLETHSDYLIDRYRYMARENGSSLDAKILFCSTSDEGNEVREIYIGSDGQIDPIPDGYRAFFLEELSRTIF